MKYFLLSIWILALKYLTSTFYTRIVEFLFRPKNVRDTFAVARANILMNRAQLLEAWLALTSV